MKLAFDLETDGLLDTVTKIHCLVAVDIETENVFSFEPHQIEEGISLLEGADYVIAHNLICYDYPVLSKLYPNHSIRGHQVDTLVMSRLMYPSDYMFQKDMMQSHIFPDKKLIGKHSLESWGYRLGFLKGDYGKKNDWSTWNREMQDYCQKDVFLLAKLYKHLMAQNWPTECIEIEHEFQKIIFQQERNGCPFDGDKAEYIARRIGTELDSIHAEIKATIPKTRKEEIFTPKVNNAKRGYIKGVETLRITEEEFNPASRQQIIEFLKKKYQWEPQDFTPKGNAQVDDEVLSSLPWPECKLFSRLFDLEKALSKIDGSEKSLLKNTKDGRVYGRMITNGAVTGRCTHQVVANIPSKHSTFGADIRSLFYAPQGFKFVGVDAKALELRILAHFLAAYDQGKYAKLILEKDIHAYNQEAAGLPTRDNAKTFIFSLIYGAGDSKLGSVVKPEATEIVQKAIGRELRDKFLYNIPALKQLIWDVRKAFVAKGYLLGLDGRRLYARAEHKALNTLIQSAGAIVCKKANTLFWQAVDLPGLEQVLQIHDEFDFICREDHAEIVATLMSKAITASGEHFRLRIPMGGESKIGCNWAEAH